MTNLNPRMASSLPEADCSISTDVLAQRIEGYIESRASGRIRDLHVVCSDHSIVLHGHSRTYHAKQLAQQAVLDLTDGHQVLCNEIEVR